MESEWGEGGRIVFFKNNKRRGSFTRNLRVHLLLFNLRNGQLFDKGVGIFSNIMGKICSKYVISLGECPSFYFWYSSDSGRISRYETQFLLNQQGWKKKKFWCTIFRESFWDIWYTHTPRRNVHPVIPCSEIMHHFVYLNWTFVIYKTC